MTLKVVDIRPQAKKDVVERVSRLLDQAKAGRVEEFAYVASMNDGTIVSDYTATSNFAERIGELVLLGHRMLVQKTRDD